MSALCLVTRFRLSKSEPKITARIPTKLMPTTITTIKANKPLKMYHRIMPEKCRMTCSISIPKMVHRQPCFSVSSAVRYTFPHEYLRHSHPHRRRNCHSPTSPCPHHRSPVKRKPDRPVGTGKKKRKLSPDGRARIAAGAKARWAAQKKAKGRHRE
jgi:hypothetical protein